MTPCAPRGTTRIEAGDVLLLYGRTESLAELDERRSDHGGRAHVEAVAKELQRQRSQESDTGDETSAAQ